MPIPAALLHAATQHPCFSGVYDAGHRIQLHHDPGAGPVDAIDFQCEDCLSFRLGCLASDLGQGVSHDQAAGLLTEHVRRFRGYALSIGGYHTAINGWLSAVYWEAAGIFVLHCERGSGARKAAVDVLIQAMQQNLVKQLHPAMLDPSEYSTHEVFLSVVPPPAVTSMAALLASPHVSASWKVGTCRVTLAEFLPVARAQAGPPASSAPPAPPPDPSGARVKGQRCDACGEIVGERWLLTTSYIGCRCG
jgi:hypothetical protein